MTVTTLDHTYKRYRWGLEAAVQWLVINAESCGYLLKYSQTPIVKKDTKEKKKKSKSKAKGKSEAKKHQTQEDTEPETPTAKEITVTVSPNEYIALAKAISASPESKIQVPAWVLHQLSDMIAVRKFFAERFTSSITKDSTTSDIPSQPPSQPPGQDMISVLNEVLQLLSSIQEKSDSSIPSCLSMGSDQFHKYTSGHPYELLFLEETVKSGQQWQKESVPQNYRFQPWETEEENMLRFQCLFEDFYATRKFVRQSWEAYNRQETDLYAVSVLTDTAMEFLRCAVTEAESFLADGPSYFSYFKFLPLAAQWAGVSIQIFAPFLEPEEKEYSVDDTAWPVAETICLPVYGIIQRFIHKPEHAYTSSDISFNKTVEHGIRPEARYAQAKHILYNFLGELWMVYKCHWSTEVSFPSPDTLTRDIFKMFSGKGKFVPNWLALGMTIYLDIYQALGPNLEMGQRDLLLSCHRIYQTIDDFFALIPSLDLVPSTTIELGQQQQTDQSDEQQTRSYIVRSVADINDAAKIDENGEEETYVVAVDETVDRLRKLLVHISWIEKDKMAYGRYGMLMNMGFTTPSIKKFLVFKIHPLWCGIIDFSYTLELQEASIQNANDWGSIASIAYLYSTVQLETMGDVFEPWRDMETLLWLYKEEFGGNPKNGSEMLSRFEETTGFEASEFGQPLPKGVTSTDLLIPKTRRLFDFFYKCYWTGHNLDLSKIQSTWDWNQDFFLTPGRVCVQLAWYLKFDFFAHKFNYLNMHMRCMRILQALHWQLDEKIATRFGSGYIEHIQHLPFLTGYILMDLCKHKSVSTLRSQAQRRYRFQQEYSVSRDGSESTLGEPIFTPDDSVSTLSSPNIEDYESVRGNNEVYDYESKGSVDEFEDYESRDPDCSVIIPQMFYEAGQIIDGIVQVEGSWEHMALESIKNPLRENPAMSGKSPMDESEEDNLVQRWVK